MLQLPKTLTFTILAIDAASSVIARVNNAIKGSKRVAEGLRDSQGRLRDEKGRYQAEKKNGGGGALDFMMGNLGATAITASLGVISQGFDSIKSSIQEAASAQTQFITSSSALATALEVPMGKAKNLMEGLQNDLSIAAAALPGENKDYIAVLNTLSDTVATSYKGDIEGFKTAITDITKRTAALASTVPNLSGEAAGQTMEMLANGNTLTSLRRLDLFQKNTPLRNNLEAQIKAAGLEGDKWTKATTKQRLDVIQKALKISATDELFSEFENSVEAITQSMKAKLIDQRTGLFGVMRKIDTREGRSVLDAFTEVLKRLRSLSAAGARLGKALGLTFDPMAKLIDLFDWVNTFLGNITFTLDVSKPSEALNNVAKSIGDSFSGLVRSAVDGVKSMDTAFLAKGIEFATNFISSVDWVSVGRFLGVAVYKLLIALVRALPAQGKLADAAVRGIIKIAIGFVVGIIEGIGVSLKRMFVDPIIAFFNKIKQWFDRLRGMLPNVTNPFTGQTTNAAQTVIGALPGGGLINSGIDLGKKLMGTLGIGGVKDKPNPQANPTADKVNAVNKATPTPTPLTPINPQATNNTTNNQASNTIGSININASTPQDGHSIASLVIEELERRLNFRSAQTIG